MRYDQIGCPRWAAMLLVVWQVTAAGPCSAAENAVEHLALLRDAYQTFSQPLPRGAMRATVFTPRDGHALSVTLVWDGEHEYHEVTDFAVPLPPGRSPVDIPPDSAPKQMQCVTGPDGTMLLHVPRRNERPVLNVDRSRKKRDLELSSAMHPDPHRFWYQATWGAELQWVTLFERLISGELAADVAATRLADGQVRLDFTNRSSGLKWELTYSPEMDCRITSYGPPDDELKSTWDWVQEPQGKWRLQEYRYVAAQSHSEPALSHQPFVLRIDEFDFDPEIASGRFGFASIAQEDGTIILEARPGHTRPIRRVVGQVGWTGDPVESDFKPLADLLRTRGFGSMTP